MDGMALVRAVREQFGSVPVIVMTAQGNEQTALDALASGAADYVPKSKLHSRLIDSLDGVLSLAAGRRVRRQLSAALEYEELRYSLENDAMLFAPLSDFFREIAVSLGLVDETGGMRLAKAVIEALRNAMYRGNLELPAEEYEDGAQLPPGDADVIAMLHNEGAYRQRRIHLCARFSRDEACFTIRDDGPGFNPAEALAVEKDPSRLSGTGGHGLVLIRMFMDEVSFNAWGYEITMIKRRAGATPPVKHEADIQLDG
jgi:CheY-like chemotaxis protein